MTKRVVLMLTVALALGLTVVACGGQQPAQPSVPEGAATTVSGAVTEAAVGAATEVSGAATEVTTGAATEISGAPGGGMATYTVKTLDTLVNGLEPADITAKPGETVDVILDNTGQTLEHSWVLLTKDQTKESAITVQQTGDEDRKLFEMGVKPGETASGAFQAPTEPGTYIVVCHIPGHAAAGMVGSLTVEP